LQYFGFLSFDLSFVVPSLQCHYNMTYFQLFLTWTLFPLAFGLALALGVFCVAAKRSKRLWPFAVWRKLTKTDNGKATLKKATSMFWLVLVLLHNYICSVVFTFYSCSDGYAISETAKEEWLTFDFGVRCGSDSYQAFRGAASMLLVLYVVIAPASLLLKLKLNRIYGRDDGALAFFTRHVRPAVWYYEILALEVRLVICGALVPVTGRGLRLCVIVVVIFAWTTVTRELRPYINRGHMALVNFLQIFVLSCVSMALIVYGDFLSDAASRVFSIVVALLSVAITVRLYSAFKNEEVTALLERVKHRKAFDSSVFDRLHVGMNVRVMDDVVFGCALAVLEDESRAVNADWKYLQHLLPLDRVWSCKMPLRTVLATHAPKLLQNAALLTRTRASAQVSEKQFSNDVDAVLGPLANDVRGNVVAETFHRFSAPTFALHCFEPAFKAILDSLIHDAAEDEDAPIDQARQGSLRSFSLRMADAHKATDKKLHRDSSVHGGLQRGASLHGENGAALHGEEVHSQALGEAPLRGGGVKLSPLGLRQPTRTTTTDDVEDGLVSAPRTLRHRLGRGPRVSPQEGTEDGAEVTDEGAEVSEDHSRQKAAFFDLAVHAHTANFRCWMVMEAAAAEILAEPNWGVQLSALADFSQGVLQAPLRGEHLAAWVAELGGESLKSRLDENVLPHALRSVALDAHPAFISALQKLVCSADQGGEAKSQEAWTSKCSLYKADQEHAVKSTSRMSVKVQNYNEEDGEWPRAAMITDPLRATVICDDSEAIVCTYHALTGSGSPFRVLRLKNKLALCTKPFNLHVNCAFDRGNELVPITVEVQIVPRAVSVVMAASHKFYTLSRAPDAKALVE